MSLCAARGLQFGHCGRRRLGALEVVLLQIAWPLCDIEPWRGLRAMPLSSISSSSCCCSCSHGGIELLGKLELDLLRHREGGCGYGHWRHATLQALLYALLYAACSSRCWSRCCCCWSTRLYLEVLHEVAALVECLVGDWKVGGLGQALGGLVAR